jgi:hypothetical protein
MLKKTAILLFIWMGFFPSLFASKVELRVALERGFVQVTHMPLSLSLKNAPAEIIERTMARLGFGRAEYGLKQVMGMKSSAPRPFPNSAKQQATRARSGIGSLSFATSSGTMRRPQAPEAGRKFTSVRSKSRAIPS